MCGCRRACSRERGQRIVLADLVGARPYAASPPRWRNVGAVVAGVDDGQLPPARVVWVCGAPLPLFCSSGGGPPARVVRAAATPPASQ